MQDALAEVDHIVDALGMPVDLGIKRIVAALHMHGIPTTASCEGHAQNGEPFPWVAIGVETDSTPYSDSLDDEVAMQVAGRLKETVRDIPHIELFTTLYRSDTNKRYGLNVTADVCQLRALDDDADEMAIRQSNYEASVKLIGLVTDFYRANPQPDYQRQLIVKPQSLWGDVDLINGGAAGSYALAADQRTTKLEAYRAEMEAFADYLVQVA